MITLRQMLGAFDESEGATALTEFVITLPIFVFTFITIAALSSQMVELNRIRYRAATAMWGEAMEIQRAGYPAPNPHGLPVLAGPDAIGIVNNEAGNTGKLPGTLLAGSITLGRSGLEMVAGSTAVAAPGSDPASATSLEFASGIASDGQFSPLMPPENTPVMVFVFAIPRTIITTRHAGIIGTRYGAVEGEYTGTVDAKQWGSYSFSARYDVLVSPVSVPAGDEMYVVGASRLLADQDPCLQTVLELSTSMSDC